MNKENRKLTSDRTARLIMLCLLVTLTCPGLLLAEDDPLLDPPDIAPAPREDTDVQEAPVFVNVDWTYEEEAVKPKSRSGGGGGGIVGAMDDVTDKMDGDPKGESQMAKATLQIPIAALVEKTGLLATKAAYADAHRQHT